MRRRATSGLTRSEHRCVKVALKGKTNQKIGEALGISERTVKVYLARAYIKLGVAGKIDMMVRLTAPVLNPFVQES